MRRLAGCGVTTCPLTVLAAATSAGRSSLPRLQRSRRCVGSDRKERRALIACLGGDGSLQNLFGGVLRLWESNDLPPSCRYRGHDEWPRQPLVLAEGLRTSLPQHWPKSHAGGSRCAGGADRGTRFARAMHALRLHFAAGSPRARWRATTCGSGDGEVSFPYGPQLCALPFGRRPIGAGRPCRRDLRRPHCWRHERFCCQCGRSAVLWIQPFGTIRAPCLDSDISRSPCPREPCCFGCAAYSADIAGIQASSSAKSTPHVAGHGRLCTRRRNILQRGALCGGIARRPEGGDTGLRCSGSLSRFPIK